MNKILSPGKRLKQVRKELGLKQSDITGGQITRNLISIIENDKASLTKNVAEIICNSINQICINRNINFRISAEDLTESTIEQSNTIVKMYLSKLDLITSTKSSDFTIIIDEIESFLIDIENNELKVQLLEKISQLYKVDFDYNNTYKYLLRAYESNDRTFNDTKHFDLLLNLSACSSMLGRYKEGLNFNRLAMIYTDHMSLELKYKFMYNMAIDYFDLKDYDHSISQINLIMSSLYVTDKQSYNLQILKSNNLKKQKNYNQSIEILNDLVRSEKEYNSLLLPYLNLLDIYLLLKDHDKVKLHIDKCLTISNKLSDSDDIKRKSSIYLNVGKGFELLGDLHQAISYFKLALDIAEEYSYYEKVHSSIDALFRLTQETKGDMNEFKNLLIELISKGSIKPNTKTLFKTIQHFNGIGDVQSVKSLLELCIEYTDI